MSDPATADAPAPSHQARELQSIPVLVLGTVTAVTALVGVVAETGIAVVVAVALLGAWAVVAVVVELPFEPCWVPPVVVVTAARHEPDGVPTIGWIAIGDASAAPPAAP